ncbi:hypothetical protein DMN91_011363 [Ooceraea biroi]|uniref:Ionotropic glutamate receptor C-terminal domain-containing protein n=2 Tax=Ooceraea biroi TaxID=2015173 RepID=A0A026W2R8_OOCBI|nr:hypothetical protein X777_11374 [Ooceraea biroi]RLU15610.1 hypothetical protein DMN91_011363 [Ooceraea biroi]
MFFNIVPVALIADSSSRVNTFEKFTLTRYSFIEYQNYQPFIQFLRKTHHLMLIASSQPILRSILQKTKDSPWANSDGFYILVDRRTEQRGCINARSYLWTAWNYDLLSVIFMCIDPNEGVVYYTFNPYSSIAPASWREVGRGKGRDSHPWILFKRNYVKDGSLCKDLNFDKTVNLNRYHIRLNAVEMQPYVHIKSDKSGLDRYTGESSEILKIVSRKLNSVLQIHVLHTSTYEIGGIGLNGTYEGMLGTLSDGRVDISLNSIPIIVSWKLRYTYPHAKSGLCVISQPHVVSLFTRIKQLMSLGLIIGTSTVSLITFIVFWKKEGFSRAGLQTMRIIVGLGVLHPPEINSTRIFVCSVLILFLNINAILQGHWSSLLTIPVFYSDTDSVESIREAGYVVYGSSSLTGLLTDAVMQTRFQGVTYDECKEFVKNSSNALCIEECLHMHYRVFNENLHKSKALRELSESYVTREDWPLYERVNQIVRQMGEFGLIQKCRDDSLFTFWLESKWRDMKEQSYKPLSMRQLKFIFIFLAGGYACSIIIFIAELVFHRRDIESRNRKKIRKKERRKQS